MHYGEQATVNCDMENPSNVDSYCTSAMQRYELSLPIVHHSVNIYMPCFSLYTLSNNIRRAESEVD